MYMVQYLQPVFHMADQTLSGDGVAPNDILSAGLSLTNADFEIALDEARSTYGQNIGAPKIPNVSWDDVGGLADVKADILDTVQLPLEYPELFASNLKKRSGTLVFRSCVPRRDTTLHFISGLTHTHRHPAIWPTRHGQDAPRKGSSDFMLAQLFLHQRSRTSKHVHRRVRSQRPPGLPARARRQALRRLLRRAGLCRAKARRARRLGRCNGSHCLSAPRRTRWHLFLLFRRGRRRRRRGRICHRRDE